MIFNQKSYKLYRTLLLPPLDPSWHKLNMRILTRLIWQFNPFFCLILIFWKLNNLVLLSFIILLPQLINIHVLPFVAMIWRFLKNNNIQHIKRLQNKKKYNELAKTWIQYEIQIYCLQYRYWVLIHLNCNNNNTIELKPSF